MKRQIEFYEHYFLEFYNSLDGKVKAKFQYVLDLIRQIEKVPEKFLKNFSGVDGLYEIRIEYQSNIYRIFCCFDKGNLVILFNAFQKKSQKTPKKEIDKAIKLMEEYFLNKQ
ncbi:type II toxin-antitoxin system RelE/ParE family toxin [Frigoriflavimonas asaccharolytica]|uniref:Phage-related protein n=1 Tax=Frigoriflavimonas asaccharolytica TaxID=2735899 RepID=A0A8J8G7W4_9FLAO|nr:type II toxin-antitoxin system RelE/ParE family toxin [Frigoriflavimonas asaccharolytica]NRS92798.1 phage-related protein [Frigoriflavimonas asaccharolytica]